nr:MAG TPA: hypothetical protein [Caudoviricetes sp.]
MKCLEWSPNMKFDEYYVRMSATPDTYEYDIVYPLPDGSYAFKTYTLAQVHEMFPDIRNNIDALISLQEHGAEILEKTVDAGSRS